MWFNQNFRDAAVDHTRESVFLFDIEIPNSYKRYATSDVVVNHIGTLKYAYKGYIRDHGRLNHIMRISKDIITSSNSNMSVTLTQDAKLRNELSTATIVLEGVTVYVRRWIEGLDFDDCPVLLKGRLANFGVNVDGTETFTIVSWESNFVHAIHPATINKELAPDHAENAGGKPYPIIYGKPVAFVMPQVQTGNPSRFLIAGHTLNSTDISTAISNNKDKQWLDNALTNPGVTPTHISGTDSGGNNYELLSYAADYTDYIMAFTIDGHRDTARGDYTRVPNSVITQPPAIIAHALINYSDYKWPDDIDVIGLKTARAMRQKWIFKAALTEEINLNEFIAGILREAFCVGFYGPNGYTINAIDIDSHPVIGFEQNMNMENLSWSEGSRDAVAHEFILNYGYRYVDGNFQKKGIASDRKNHGVRYFDAQCSRARKRYGKLEPMRINSMYIDNRATAARLAKEIVDFFTVMRKEIDFTTSWEYGFLQMGDMLSITHTHGPGGGWSNKRFFVTGISYGKDDINISAMEA